MINNGFGCRHRPGVLEDFVDTIALYPIPGVNGDQNVAALHLLFVLPRFVLPHSHANQGAR
jgi:hypothetical protein